MSTSRRSPLRPGPLAVGLAFLVHPLEEAATDFPLWFRATIGGDLGPVTFAVINTVGLLVVTAAVAVHRRRGDFPVVPAALGTLFVLNAGIHALAAFLTAGYVPGVVTGLLVWAPVGVVLLKEATGAEPGALRRGVGLGVAAQALVTATALLV